MTVRHVDVETPGPEPRTNAYAVGTDDALLVDPGGRSPELDALVDDAGVGHVAVTHHHPDHLAAVAHYADASDATVWARAGRADDFQAAAGVGPDRTFRPGDVLPAGDGRVTVVDAPGHAPEHVAFRTGDEALVGDLAVAEGSVAVAAPEGDLRAYLTSLRRLALADLDRLRPGHGPPVDDPRGTCHRLLAHRRDRERRVERAVRGGARTVDEIVDAAYEKDVAGVRDLARATVRAHLEKLAVERRLSWDGERATP